MAAVVQGGRRSGLLQTEGYLRRQIVLDRDGLSLALVLDESILRRRIWTPATVNY